MSLGIPSVASSYEVAKMHHQSHNIGCQRSSKMDPNNRLLQVLIHYGENLSGEENKSSAKPIIMAVLTHDSRNSFLLDAVIDVEDNLFDERNRGQCSSSG